MMLTEGELLRFWPKVDVRGPDECWLWTGARTGRGYASFGRERGGSWGGHRVMWEAMHGEIGLGLCVCHSCDNPPCVNPLHLFLGTQADNLRDMLSKGRGTRARGEQHGHAKLTCQQVLEIRALAGDVSERALGRRFGVAHVTVGNIVRGSTWAWLEGEQSG